MTEVSQKEKAIEKSTYLHYVPSSDQREKKMEYKWIMMRNKELRDKREQEEQLYLK